MEDRYEIAATKLKNARCGVALTGAGISVESGIPDFRSPSGLWSKYDPEEYGYIESFRKNPAKVWRMILEVQELLNNAHPNPAHISLAELERAGHIKAVITQNIDSLHQRAGSVEVIEYHGHARTLRCDFCGQNYLPDMISLDELPPRCVCTGPIRPNFVFFGEPIPTIAHRRSMEYAARCDVMLVIGTSATVAPASYLPYIAKERGAYIVEINPSPSAISETLTDLYIGEPAGRALPLVVEALRRLKGGSL
ncbi:MAG: NAD-dependent deacylase [Syntrophobacterales bacterium]|nr:NAD-dependent deacylase [Syntrophobacterales bacterium]